MRHKRQRNAKRETSDMIVEIFKRHCVITWYYTMAKSVTRIVRGRKIHIMCVKHEPSHRYIPFNDIQRDRYGNFDLSVVVENHFRLERVKRIVLLFISNVNCIGIFIEIVCIVASNVVAIHYYGNGE